MGDLMEMENVRGDLKGRAIRTLQDLCTQTNSTQIWLRDHAVTVLEKSMLKSDLDIAPNKTLHESAKLHY